MYKRVIKEEISRNSKSEYPGIKGMILRKKEFRVEEKQRQDDGGALG